MLFQKLLPTLQQLASYHSALRKVIPLGVEITLKLIPAKELFFYHFSSIIYGKKVSLLNEILPSLYVVMQIVWLFRLRMKTAIRMSKLNLKKL